MAKNSVIISISLPADLHQKLVEACELTGKTRSKIIYEALQAYLSNGNKVPEDVISIQPSQVVKPANSNNNNNVKVSHEKFW